MQNNFLNILQKSFKFKLILLIIIISIIPLSILGYFNVDVVRGNLENRIYSQMQITAQRLAADQKTIIGGQIEKITSLARIYGGRLLDSQHMEQEGVLYSLLKEAPYLEEIYLVNREGQEVARASRRLVVGSNLRNLKEDKAFRELIRGNTQWSNTFLDQYGQVRLKKVIPIYSQLSGEIRGGMIIEISLRRVVEQLAQRQLGQQGRIFVVDGKGKLIGHQDFSQVLKQVDVRGSLSVRKFIEDKSGIVSTANRYVSYDGQEVLGVFAPISGLDWAVIQEIPVKIALASVNLLIRKLMVAGIVLVFLAIIVSIFFGIRFSSSLRSLEQGVLQIRNGNLDYEVKVKGRDEFSQLAQTLNDMRLELRIRRQQEEAMRQAEKLSSLGLLASGVAHELNNPLGVVSAYAEDLLDRLEEEEIDQLVKKGELNEYLQVIIKQAKRCKEIISNLLNFARHSKGENEKIDLQQVVGNTLKLVKYRIKKEKIVTEINIEKNLPAINANTGEIQQVLLNIITNALDALPTGGWLNIVAFKSKENICLQIEDNGQGINAQDLPKIFDPFFTTKEPGKGTGLGLSICYGIMQKLGGKIEVESHPGEGTSVTLYFPLATKSLVTISRPKDDL